MRVTSRLLVVPFAAFLMLVSTVAVAQPVAANSPTASAPPTPIVDFDMVANFDELTEQHATLFRLYRAFFLREPDGPGALYWIERQERCDGLGAIADEFAAGDEFANRYGPLDDGQFVERIYRNVLGRAGETEGLRYWTDLVVNGELSRGEMVLYVSQSSEFRRQHPYPSDGVPGRGCRLPRGETPTARTFVEVGGQLLATIEGRGTDQARADVHIMAPAAIIEYAGFHQSMHPGAQGMVPSIDTAVPWTTMASRNRDTHPQGAIDIPVHPLVPIMSPVSGTVLRSGDYVLYCTYRDGYVVIEPDGRPDLEVKVLHVQDVVVRAGERVEPGDQIAARATPFPFRSQVDEYTAEPSWPHVHIETIDPSVPRNPSNGRSC